LTSTPITYGAARSSFLSGNATWAPASGAGRFLPYYLTSTVDQSGTATGSYTGLPVNMTETQTFGTDSRLMSLSRNGLPQFVVMSTGATGISTTTRCPLDIYVPANNEGLRVNRANAPSQYLSLNEGNYKSHNTEAYGISWVCFGSSTTCLRQRLR
jgi:hypothetical protein